MRNNNNKNEWEEIRLEKRKKKKTIFPFEEIFLSFFLFFAV